MAASIRTRLTQWNHLPRDARDTLFLLCVIGCVLVPLFAHLPVWAGLLCSALLVWRGALAVLGRPLPPRWLLVALLVLAIAATMLSFKTILGREAGVTLVALLLVLKTLEARARRDALVIFFLGFFTMLSNFFFSQSLPTAFFMLLALVGLLTALVNAHMPVGRPPLSTALRAALRMALFGTPVMVALFVFFPRMAPLWGLPSDSMSGRSGLSGSMQVGNIAELALDDSIALRIRFEGGPEDMPPRSALYFRGPVLSDFDGREWQASPVRDSDASPSHLQVQGKGYRYEALLEPNQRPWLVLLDASPDGPQSPSLRAFMARDLEWLSMRPVNELLRYQATSYPDFTHGPKDLDRRLRSHTYLPNGSNPRTQALAQSLLAEPSIASGGTQALVSAVQERLRTQGYTYTLEPGLYGAQAADEFWFDRKAGFCEHIAASFVILMRAAQVPARVVTGYQGGEINPVDGYWTVRQSDAHAWAEVWMEGQGWVRVDPTGSVAPDRIGALQRLQPRRSAMGNAVSRVISPGMAQQLRAVWEAANNRWNQWVLNYTQSRQLDLLKTLGFDAPDWQDLVHLLASLVVAAAVGGGLWAAWERMQHDPWLQLLERARAAFAKAGLKVSPHMPPRAMAAAARAHWGAAGEPIAAWLIQLETQRYAPPTTQSAIAPLRKRFAALTWPRATPQTHAPSS